MHHRTVWVSVYHATAVRAIGQLAVSMRLSWKHVPREPSGVVRGLVLTPQKDAYNVKMDEVMDA